MSIKAKFFSVLVLMIFSTVFSSTYMYYTMFQNSTRLDDLKTRQLRGLQLAESNYRLFQQYGRNLEVAISTAELNIIIESKEIISTIKKNLSELFDSTAEQNEKYNQKIAMLDTYYIKSKRCVLTSIDLSDKPEDFRAAVENFRPIRDQLSVYFIESRKQSEARYISAVESLNRFNRNSLILNITISTSISLFVLLLMFAILNRIMTRMNALRQHFLDLELNNLMTMKNDEKSNDEMTQLIDYTNDMIENLKKSRENLVEKNVLDEIIHSMQTMLIIAGPDNKVEKINRLTTEYTGYSPDELLGQDISDLFKLEVEGDVSFTPFRNILLTKDGRELPIFLSYTQIQADNTDDILHVYNCMDMTAIVRAEEERESLWAQLNQASKLASLGTLGAGVAHELNNPLVAVRGFAYSILNKESLSEFSEKGLRKIIVASERMQNIIDHLRDFSRNTDVDKIEIVSIERCIGDAMVLLGKQLEGSQIAIDITPPVDEIFISGNNNQLESVIENLLTNSRDAFTDLLDIRTKKIVMWFTLVDQFVTIHYQDNGAGMSPDEINKIFDPFYTTKEVGKGTGLGLSITHDILKRHNAKINVSSKVGSGTKFEITFPVTSVEVRKAKDRKVNEHAEIKPVAAEIRLSTRPKVVIIDDESAIGEVLELFLEDDFDTTFFENPIEGVEYLRENSNIDLLITDLKMPQISGHEVIERVRVFNEDIPIIVSSGHAKAEGEIQVALNLGANAALPKPYGRPEDVVRMIVDLLQDQEKLREVG